MRKVLGTDLLLGNEEQRLCVFPHAKVSFFSCPQGLEISCLQSFMGTDIILCFSLFLSPSQMFILPRLTAFIIHLPGF